MVLAGIVNKSLVAAMVAAGNPAIGLVRRGRHVLPRAQESRRRATTWDLWEKSVRSNRAGWTPFGAKAAFRCSRRWRSARMASTTT